MEDSRIYVSLEFTPNPNTLKYSVNRELLTSATAANFTSLEEAKEGSPLAQKLFEAGGIAGVMIGRDFVTVTKAEDGEWDEVHQNASSIIENHLNEGETAVTKVPSSDTASDQNTSEGTQTEQKIKEILNNEIRPAVAMDGGDIQFEKYEDGVVYLYLQGSCSGCPSSTMTLKMGIENRLREDIPEIQEVVSV